MANASVNLEFGGLHPFDSAAGDSTDWAHAAARGIVADMQDRPELNAVLEAMDESMRNEFVSSITDIIREAQAADTTTIATPAADTPAE